MEAAVKHTSNSVLEIVSKKETVVRTINGTRQSSIDFSNATDALYYGNYSRSKNISADVFTAKLLRQKAADFVHVLSEVLAPAGIQLNTDFASFSFVFQTEQLQLTFERKLLAHGIKLSASAPNYISVKHSASELNLVLEAIYQTV